MPKDRGMKNIDLYLDNFTKLITVKIKKKGKVKILDAGCGYGIAMAELVKIFGEKVEVVGFNYSKHDGNKELLKRELLKKKVFSRIELKKIKNFPKFIYCDASNKLPFKDHEFDFIYSMISMYLFDDKIAFLEECNRILKKDGIARISPAFGRHDSKLIRGQKGVPEYYQYFWEVWDKGKQIKIWEYCNKTSGVRSIWKNRLKGDNPMYIEIFGNVKVNFKLRFISSVDLNLIWNDWGGVKSIYTTQLREDFNPRYRKQ